VLDFWLSEMLEDIRNQATLVKRMEKFLGSVPSYKITKFDIPTRALSLHAKVRHLRFGKVKTTKSSSLFSAARKTKFSETSHVELAANKDSKTKNLLHE
jgi:hypothetical protein